MDANVAGKASGGVCGQHKQKGGGVGADEAGVFAPALYGK